jgi:hypothetical protein
MLNHLQQTYNVTWGINIGVTTQSNYWRYVLTSGAKFSTAGMLFVWSEELTQGTRIMGMLPQHLSKCWILNSITEQKGPMI